MVFGSPFGSLYHQRIGYPSRNTDPYEGLGPPFLAVKGSPKEDHGEVHFCGVRFLFTTGQTSGFFLEAGRVQPRRRQQLKKAANDLASFRPSAWTFRPTKFASDISGDASLFSAFFKQESEPPPKRKKHDMSMNKCEVVFLLVFLGLKKGAPPKTTRICCLPLLVLKSIYHCWKVFFVFVFLPRGKQMEEVPVDPACKVAPCKAQMFALQIDTLP